MLQATVRVTLRLGLCRALPEVHRGWPGRRSASTVFAVSSGQGKCGVSVVRVTGEQASAALTSMTTPSTLPRPRTATLRRIIHPHTGEGLDRGLVLWFPGPHSFTGEDSCELHVHGGSAVVAAVLAALSTLPGYRPAQPGDFTKRAFCHGKLDLTSVEGLGDLIHAETEAQRRQALRQMEGALATLYTGWRHCLLQCRASLEAYIDFSEDENIEEGVVGEVEGKLHQLVKDMQLHLADDRRGERLRNGLQLAILGRPNAGKSSLLNALTQRPTAIVSPTPGTTRDVVETMVDLGGYPLVLSDTAGLRTTTDPVEAEGVSRALARAGQADLAIVILEAPEILLAVKEEQFEWSTYLRDHLIHLGIITEHKDGRHSPEWLDNQNFLTVVNKMDLLERQEDHSWLQSTLGDPCVLLSVRTQEGFNVFLQRLKALCSSLCDAGAAESPTLTAARHRTHIASCLEALRLVLGHDATGHASAGGEGGSGSLGMLEEGHNLLQAEETVVLAANLLQRAATSLGHVTGNITSEDVLDHIFSAFCIGK